MANWVRLWDDMPTDPKWRVIAKRAGRPISEVLAVFVFMMTSAGNGNERKRTQANAGEEVNRGVLENWDDEDVAAALDVETAHVIAIREAMQGKTLDGDKLTGWEKRQPKREDSSEERAREWRERKRTQTNAPDTDTDTDTDTEKERERKISTEFSEGFWPDWPHKVGKPVAAKAFQQARNRGHSAATILDGMARYIADKPPDRAWLNPATFLNQERFLDVPAIGKQACAQPNSGQKPSNSHVFVLYDSKAWRAWEAHLRAEGGRGPQAKLPTRERRGPDGKVQRGWDRPSLFPPKGTGPPVVDAPADTPAAGGVGKNHEGGAIDIAISF